MVSPKNRFTEITLPQNYQVIGGNTLIFSSSLFILCTHGSVVKLLFYNNNTFNQVNFPSDVLISAYNNMIIWKGQVWVSCYSESADAVNMLYAVGDDGIIGDKINLPDGSAFASNTFIGVNKQDEIIATIQTICEVPKLMLYMDSGWTPITNISTLFQPILPSTRRLGYIPFNMLNFHKGIHIPLIDQKNQIKAFSFYNSKFSKWKLNNKQSIAQNTYLIEGGGILVSLLDNGQEINLCKHIPGGFEIIHLPNGSYTVNPNYPFWGTSEAIYITLNNDKKEIELWSFSPKNSPLWNKLIIPKYYTIIEDSYPGIDANTFYLPLMKDGKIHLFKYSKQSL